MTDQEFQRIVDLMGSKYGIQLGRKRVIVEGRLDNYLASRGMTSYSEYMDRVEADFSGKELQNLVSILTTNHTYFLREAEHFEYFKDVVLPQLKQCMRNTKDLRIWSAAASSGEEAYTLAMIIKDFLGIEYPDWDTSILATDISVKVLRFAIKGVYLSEQVRPLPDRWIKSNFNKINEDQYEITQEIKKHVLFRQFNLMDPLPFKKRLHVVFLRNVMIYFNEETKIELLNKIYDVIEPGGYLFIGATESIHHSDTKFKFVRPSVFQK